MIKAKAWKEDDLKGTWTVQRKIDGIRMLRDTDGNPCSRNGKPLYNLGAVPSGITDCEIFAGDWPSTVTACKKKIGGTPIDLSWVYSLYPVTDPRLVLAELVDPTALQIRTLLDQQVALGDEGLILRQGDKWLKVKTKYTADVRVTGLMAGGGKYVGVLGAFETDFGNVGTGLTDAERARYNSESMIGALIEVEFMEMTPAGKFRHPRFVRIREDKDEVSIESEIPDHKGGS
jgi:hypothetical protein